MDLRDPLARGGEKDKGFPLHLGLGDKGKFLDIF
jgi:hypothetical protein